MNMLQVLLISAGALMLVGIFGIITRKNIIKILLAINVLQTGVNLLLVAIGWVQGGNAPILGKSLNSTAIFTDPLPQALVLTSIVIGFGTTAVGLAIAINYYKTHGSLDTFSFGNEKTESEKEEVSG